MTRDVCRLLQAAASFGLALWQRAYAWGSNGGLVAESNALLTSGGGDAWGRVLCLYHIPAVAVCSAANHANRSSAAMHSDLRLCAQPVFIYFS